VSVVGARTRAAAAVRPARVSLVLPVALWLAAALISGFTLWRHLEPFDEGLLLQVTSRISDGQWPYRDFGWAYGPGQPLLVSLGWEAFGRSVVTWRVIRVAADATIALLVWALARREAPPRWALAGWLAAALTIAQPTSANPFAPALAFALGAVYAATRGHRVTAGLLVAGASFWRPDVGAAALAAVVVAAGFEGRTKRGPIVVAAAALAGGAVLYAPFAVAAGLPRVWDSLVAEAARDGDWWRLPFPFLYDGPLPAWPPRELAERLKDLLGYELPLIGVIGLAATLAALATNPRRISPAAAGLATLSLASLAYLLSRPDDLHAQPLLICLCGLIPMAAPGRAGGPRPLAAVLAALLALVLAAGAANRLSALLLPPELEPVHLAGVPGIRVPPEEARALPPMVALVQRLVPPGEPIYVAPRRSDLVTLSDPLVHFLVDRPNVLRRDVLLQAWPAEQAAIVAALERARPQAVVRWTDPASSRPEPNRRGRPSGSRALDDYLARAYRLRGRFGAYDVLEPR
jgi:hypothetical protein